VLKRWHARDEPAKAVEHRFIDCRQGRVSRRDEHYRQRGQDGFDGLLNAQLGVADPQSEPRRSPVKQRVEGGDAPVAVAGLGAIEVALLDDLRSGARTARSTE